MPELPEVETVKRSLEAAVIGVTITEIAVSKKRLRFHVSLKVLNTLVGHHLKGIRRRAKYLLFDFSNDVILLAHLGMTGKFYLADHDMPLRAHDHVIFSIGGDKELRFNDVRRFGFLDVFAPEKESAHPRLKHLGLEPLEKEFDGDYLLEKSRKSKKPIKNFIMDPKVVVGVGNIYASEALFLARVHPQKIASKLTRQQCDKLASAIKKVLNDSIAQGGTTLKDFASLNGERGYFAVQLQVYGRQGEPCVVCSKAIERVVLAGRSTFFCKYCQK